MSEIDLTIDPKDNITQLKPSLAVEYFRQLGITTMTESWLTRMRMKENKGKGPRFTKICNRAHYTKKAIHDHLNKKEG